MPRQLIQVPRFAAGGPLPCPAVKAGSTARRLLFMLEMRVQTLAWKFQLSSPRPAMQCCERPLDFFCPSCIKQDVETGAKSCICSFVRTVFQTTPTPCLILSFYFSLTFVPLYSPRSVSPFDRAATCGIHFVARFTLAVALVLWSRSALPSPRHA